MLTGDIENPIDNAFWSDLIQRRPFIYDVAET
jgi:hypothetical protein